MNSHFHKAMKGGWVLMLTCLAAAGNIPAEESAENPATAKIQSQTFAGLLYIKHGRVGTRSEGPDYFLQTQEADYLLTNMERHPWEKDGGLESLARKMVAVRGKLSDGKIQVEKIAPIDIGRIPQAPLPALVAGNGQFAVELLQRLADGNKEGPSSERNLAVSPFSISTVLAMTLAGARGETASQMAKVLQFNEVPPVLLHDTYTDLLRVVQQNPRANFFTIHTANRLWVERELVPSVLPAFRDITEGNYDAEMATLDFQKDPSGSRQTINHWVNDHTSDKIPELLPDGSVDKSTRLVLTDAVHFAGYWGTPFDPESTRSSPFHLSTGKVVEVPTMWQNSLLPYRDEDELQVVALPVRGGMFSMVFIVPKEQQTLAALRSRLSGRSLMQLLRSTTAQRVELHLPRFLVSSNVELKSMLTAMGMSDAFKAEAADFSGINGQKNLYIDQVFHQALVSVNESGIEATAASAVVAREMSSAPAATLVRLNRPFLFALRDNRTECILFLGQIVKPTE